MSSAPRPAIPLPEAMPLSPPDDFALRLSALGVTLDAQSLGLIGDYLARLLAMNQLMNLTAITDPTEAWHRHALDALTLVPLLSGLPAGARLADIGSGGGVPGIVLAIARPDLGVMLFEATQKKANFLTQVVGRLGLTNVSVRAQRVELAGALGLRGVFDIATARAVGRIAALAPLIATLVKSGGRILLIKGQRADQELAEARWVLKEQRLSHESTIDTPTGRIVVLRRGATDARSVNCKR